MQLNLSYPLSEASRRFDSFFAGGPFHIPNSKKTIWGKKKVNSGEMQTFVLKTSDSRFLFAGIPKAYVIGRLKADGKQTDLTTYYAYPFQMYFFYCVLVVVLILHTYALLVIALIALLPTMEILIYNSSNKEELLKTISLIFEDQSEHQM